MYTGEVTLLDHTTVTVDISSLKHKEWVEMLTPGTSDEDTNVIAARLCGLTVEQVENLPEVDYRRIFQKVFELVRQPLSDPN